VAVGAVVTIVANEGKTLFHSFSLAIICFKCQIEQTNSTRSDLVGKSEYKAT